MISSPEAAPWSSSLPPYSPKSTPSLLLENKQASKNNSNNSNNNNNEIR